MHAAIALMWWLWRQLSLGEAKIYHSQLAHIHSTKRLALLTQLSLSGSHNRVHPRCVTDCTSVTLFFAEEPPPLFVALMNDA